MHTHFHRVRGAEVDNQSFVFNTRYLEVADAALTEFLRAEGFLLGTLLEEGFDPSVVKITAEYLRPAKLDDLLEVDSACVHVGRSSFTMSYVLRRGEVELVRVQTVYVNVDVKEERSRSLPTHLADHLRTIIEPVPETTEVPKSTEERAACRTTPSI